MAKAQDDRPETGQVSSLAHAGSERGEVPPSEVGMAPLEEEIRFYSQHLAEWAANEGRHVLIRGSELCGFYASRDEALREGLQRFGRVPFLVKQVIRDERPRPLGPVIF